MQNCWYLGLDGGGTKTRCALYNTATDTLLTVRGGSTNHEALPGGMGALADAVSGIVFPLLEQAGVSADGLRAAAFGMSGVDTPMQHEFISQILAGMGFSRFLLSNDAYLGVKAEVGRSGVSAVNGTGYSVAGIAADGRTMQIGGHNDLTGDLGGSGYLVPAAIRAVYTALFKRGEETALTGMFFDWLGIDARDAFCQAVAMQIYGAMADTYRRISQLLHEAAGAGDAVARRILIDSGEDYALSIRCIAEELALPSPVDVVLLGSQFTRCECPLAIDTLRSSLAKAGDYRIRIISTEPVAGALLWAMELDGVQPEDEAGLKERIRQSFGGCAQ